METKRECRLIARSECKLITLRDAADLQIPISDLTSDFTAKLAKPPISPTNYYTVQFDDGWIIGSIVGDGDHNLNNISGTYLRFRKDEDLLNIERAVKNAVRLSMPQGASVCANGLIIEASK